MKRLGLLAKVLVLSLSMLMPYAWGAVAYIGPSGHAENVTIANLVEGDGIVILTFSGPLTGSPACAAQHKDSLVIGNGSNSPDADKARGAFKSAQPLKVAGGGICNRLSGYETLSSIEPMP